MTKNGECQEGWSILSQVQIQDLLKRVSVLPVPKGSRMDGFSNEIALPLFPTKHQLMGKKFKTAHLTSTYLKHALCSEQKTRDRCLSH